MANRFNQAGRNQYTSQFVPKQLPLALMAQGLTGKQSQYNKTETAIADSREAFNQTAYGTTHKAKLKEYEQEFDTFVENSYNRDLTSREFQREYKEFAAKFKNNEDLKTIKTRMDHVTTMQEELLKIEQSGKKNSARWWRVKKQLDIANSDDDVFSNTLNDLTIGETQDTRKAQEDVFNHIKASGSQTLKEIQGVFYKTGWKGVSNSKIGKAAVKAYAGFRATPAGEQEALEYQYAVDNDVVDPDEVSETDFIFGRLLAVGESFESSDSTTNIDTALNTIQSQRQAAADTQTPPIIVAGSQNATHSGTFEENRGVDTRSEGAIEDSQRNIAAYEAQAVQFEDAINLEVTEDNMNMVSAAKHGNKLIAAINGEGPPLTVDETKEFKAQFTPQLNQINENIKETQRGLDAEEIRMAESLAQVQRGMDREGNKIVSGDELMRSTEELGGMEVDQAIKNYLGKEAGIDDRDQIEASMVAQELQDLWNNPEMLGLMEDLFAGHYISGDNHEESGTGDIIMTEGNELRMITGNGASVAIGVKFYTDKILEGAMNRTQLDSSDPDHLSAAAYENLLKEVKDIRTVGYAYEAKLDINRAIADAEKHPEESALITAYNNNAPIGIETTAIAKELGQTYQSYDANGRKGGKQDNPSYVIESLVRAQPISFSYKDRDGKVIHDLDDYDIAKGTVVSINIANADMNTENVSFTLNTPMTIMSMDATTIANLRKDGILVDDNFEGKEHDGDLIIADLSDDQLAEIKLKLSTKMVPLTVTVTDPNAQQSINTSRMNKELSLWGQNKNSTIGQEAYVRYLTYSNPELGSDLKQTNALRPGESFPIVRQVYNYAEGKKNVKENVTYTVKKLEGTGSESGYFSLVTTAQDGSVINEGGRTFRNIHEVSSYILSLEERQQALLDAGILQPGEVYSTTQE